MNGQQKHDTEFSIGGSDCSTVDVNAIDFALQCMHWQYSLLYTTVLTYDDANFTALIIKATCHHGSHCIIDHGHDVCVIVLWGQ